MRDGWEGEVFCYVTTRGRVSGRAHRIEIWFAAHGDTLYVLAGGGDGADWVRNIAADPAVTLEVAGEAMPATGRVVGDRAEAALARRLVAGKYAAHEQGLDAWARTALPVAIEPAP